MGDFVPQEELEKFMARCTDPAAQKATKEAARRLRFKLTILGTRFCLRWAGGKYIKSGTEMDVTAFPMKSTGYSNTDSVIDKIEGKV
ncbi:SURP and G-patch domain-containing protein 1-like protein [Lolium perenne]|uniref:SURP and G-patch domain-containing protein 1-like protein n=1 Tax=Lolium perenne TaxID=4522 RepID=UPI0021EB5345